MVTSDNVVQYFPNIASTITKEIKNFTNIRYNNITVLNITKKGKNTSLILQISKVFTLIYDKYRYFGH